MRSVLIISSLYSQIQHIKSLLALHPEKFRLAGTCDNSVLGMSLIESTLPDIVIMPVHMNFWNAEDLINYLLPRGIAPMFVLLETGEPAELSEPVRSCVLAMLPAELPTEQMLMAALMENLSAAQNRRQNPAPSIHNPLVQHSLEVMELLMGLNPTHTGAAQAQFGRLRVGSNACWVILGKQPTSEGMSYFNEPNRMEAVFSRFQQVLEPVGRSEVCIYRDHDLCILLEGGQAHEPDWHILADELNGVLHDLGFQPFQYEISDVPLPLERWHGQCNELLQLRQERFFYSPLYLQPKSMLAYRSQVSKNQILGTLSALSVAFQDRNLEEITTLLLSLETMVSHSLSQEIYAFVYAQLWIQYSQLCHSYGLHDGGEMLDIPFREFRTVQEAFDIFRQLYHKLFSVRKSSHGHPNETVSRICNYIHQNLSEPLTLEAVAKQVHISPTYLCRLFKKETGCSYNTYVNEQRIAKASQLLAMEYKIIDIAGMVGFDNAKYFSRVFKKQTGKTPQQYRLDLRREERA